MSSTINQPMESIIGIYSRSHALKTLGFALLGSLVIALSSQIAIPLEPIPVTLQTLVVMLIGLSYGPRLGCLTIACYLFEGAIGLPVFAQWRSGLPILLGPSGGYLIGFLPAVFLSGYLLQRGWAKNYITAFFAIFLGTGFIYFMGLSFLTFLIGWSMAIKLGLLPFLGFELVKIIALTSITPNLYRNRN